MGMRAGSASGVEAEAGVTDAIANAASATAGSCLAERHVHVCPPSILFTPPLNRTPPLAVSVSSITVVSPGQQSTLPALRKPLLSVDDAAPPTR